MPVSRYVTLRAIKHSGTDFPIGSPMALSDDYAAPLLAIGAIQAQAGDLPAMPTIAGNVVRETLDTSTPGKKKRSFVEVTEGGDGRIRKVAGGNGEKWLQTGGQSHFAPQMKLVLSATAPVTRHAAFVVPFGFSAFKLRMFNAHTAAVDYKYAFTTQGALGDAIYNAATWTPVTVGGSAAITIPGCTGVPPDHSLSYVDSDTIYLGPGRLR